ncbi:nucleolar complex-associated protein 2 isoform X2 [Salvia hispanica]|uniref:nucleolar complex-associated protein 2 isoform X2 n=1 Tax=Salvia hispanica TaxID=49212 RepID=UPI002009232D|nr:nucleolar complex-associated protein 2 isoform X2 [Salvia hispanica]
MGKLGKKARKFAKKHLQSVLKQRRKTKALFKRKAPKNGKNDSEEETVDDYAGTFNGRNSEPESTVITSLDAAFTENETDEIALASDSDGYLSEDPSCPYSVESETEKTLEDTIVTVYSAQNNKIHSDLAALKKKLDRLRKKDPGFNNFLESFKSSAETIQNDDSFSDEGDSSDHEEQGEDDLVKDKEKFLSNQVIVTWCRMVKEDNSQSAFVGLLNAYRTACHYGVESVGHKIDSSETFCNILIFTLSNADDVFRGMFQISSSNSKKETVEKLQKNSKIRASLIFFVAFPSLVQRLLKATVHLWATSGRVLSSASFLVIRDVAAMFGSDHFDTCLAKTSRSFLSRSRVTEITDIEHMEFLRDSVVELCCLDVQKSSVKAVASLSQCAKIFSLATQTKKKEAVKKICSWEYVNCVDMWVRFISANIRDFDLQSLFFMTVKLINGVAHMFPGPRYLPLRLKSIEWLNCLSSSSGTFIPVASLVLDILEYKVAGEGRKAQIAFDTASVLKLPKHYLKSKSFQDECFQSAVKQLAFHFSQWSFHISFPDLATIPLIRLRRILDITTLESLRRIVKRMIDQVEQNVDFVQKKREDAPFSPLDHQSADSFLQLEKSSLNSPFTQYYRSVLDKACERKLHKFDKKSLPELKTSKKNAAKPKRKPVAAKDHPAENGMVNSKRRRKGSP